MSDEEIKNEFISCIEGSHTLNLAISILEDRERLQNIIKEARELIKNECWGDNSSRCIDDLIYYKCDELLDILDKENKL